MQANFKAFVKSVSIKNLLTGDKSVHIKLENAGLSEIAEMAKVASADANHEVEVIVKW